MEKDSSRAVDAEKPSLTITNMEAINKKDTAAPAAGKEENEKALQNRRCSSTSKSHGKVVAPRRRDGMSDVTDRDVLSGRGGCTNTHPGNRLFRRLVRVNQATYKDVRTSPNVKHLLAISIIEAIRRHGGRYMQRDPKNKRWVEVPPKEARNKTTQALRGEVYLKNPGKGDWYAKKRPEPGTRKRPEAGSKASQKKFDQPFVAQQQESVPAALFAKQYVHESLRKEKEAMNTDSSSPSDPQPSHDKTQESRASSTKPQETASENEDTSVFLEALQGMTGKSFDKKKKARPLPVKKGCTSLGREETNAANGLMSLAALAGMIAEKEESEKKLQKEELMQGQESCDPVTSLPSRSASALIQHGLPPTTYGSTKKPLISPTLSPAIVPPAMAPPPMIPLGGTLLRRDINSMTSNFQVAAVKYNSLPGGSIPRTEHPATTSSLDHRNWNLAAAGLSTVPTEKLLLNPLLWQAHAAPAFPVNGLDLGLGRANRNSFLEQAALEERLALAQHQRLGSIREEMLRSTIAAGHRRQGLYDSAVANAYNSIVSSRSDTLSAARQSTHARLENSALSRSTDVTSDPKEIDGFLHSKKSVGPLKKRKGFASEHPNQSSSSKMQKLDQRQHIVVTDTAQSFEPGQFDDARDDDQQKDKASGPQQKFSFKEQSCIKETVTQ